MSEPTTDADDDIVDAFFGLGLSAAEIKERWQQVQPLLEVAAVSEHQRDEVNGMLLGSYHDDLPKILRSDTD